jgi:cytochrome c553
MRMSALALGVAFVGPFVVGAAGCEPDPTRVPAAAPPAAETTPSVLGAAPALGPAPLGTSVTKPVEPTTPLPTTTPDVSDAPPPTASQMAARPISGGTLRILSDGRTAVAADSDRDQVYVVDLLTKKVTSTVTLTAGDEPGRLVEDGAGLVHVALRSGGAVATIDPKTGTLLARRALCAAPRGLTVDASTQTLHVACAGGELVSIAAAPTTTTPSRVLHLDRDLRDVLVKNGQLLVSTFRASQVLVVGADGTLVNRLAPAEDFNAGNAAVAWRMIDGPGDKTTLLHQRGSVQQIGTFPGAYGRFGGCGSIVTSTSSVVAADGTSMASGPGFQGALVAADAALSPDGTELAVVSIAAGDDETARVQFFAASSGDSSAFEECESPDDAPAAPTPSSDGTGDGDQGALPGPGAYLPPNGQVIAVAFDQRGNVIVQSREPATLQILTQRVDPVVLSTDSRFDAGHMLFHTATSNQIACVSCHPEGGEDGRVWQFQSLGARRTQSLRGGIMDTAPFHWGGDEAGLPSIMTDVFQGRMGGASVDAAGVAALNTWLGQIPTIPVSQWTDAATVARGQTVFSSAGCVACHAGADYTNNLNVDVGTGQAFQVPQLHGLGFRAPYMHDGCAATLKARLTPGTCGGDARHGAVASLSTTQIADLTAYLDTL